MSSDLFGDFVALQYVLEGFDLETKLVGDSDQHQNLAGDVAVSVNITLTFEHFHQWFELQVASWWDQVLLSFCNCGVIFVPSFFVIPRFRECFANRFFNAHSGVWITTSNTWQIRV